MRPASGQALGPPVKPRPFRRAGLRNPFAETEISTTALAMIAVGGLWLLIVFVANPTGEFPLNDDWSYARAVQTLVEHGRLELTGFTSMPLVAQVLWGALFCLPFGFSFTALRLSTITLGLVGLIATHRLLKEMKVSEARALLAVLVLAVNPLYFLLSLTFMTDVPFFTSSMLAILFLLRALRNEGYLSLVTGYAFSLIAMLIRQPAIVIPVSFLVAYWVKNRIGLRTLGHALVPTGAFAGLLLAFPALLRRTIGLPALYNRSYEPIAESAPLGALQIPAVFANRLFVQLIYVGLFLIPFSITLRLSPWQTPSRPMKRLRIFAGSALFFAMAGFLVWQGRRMPLTGNVLFDAGLGPVLLRDTYVLGLPHWPTAPKEFWLAVTVLAILGSVLLIHRLSDTAARMIRLFIAKSRVELASAIFLLSTVVLYSGLISITGYTDRYLFWLLPMLMGVMLVPGAAVRLRAPGWTLWVSAALMLVYGFFALAGTHDYLAWNRARWQALTELVEKDGVSYANIDGGFEFNGWYAYDASYRTGTSKSWWWVENDDYVISFGPVSGYVETRRYSFERWAPPFEQGQVLVLRRAQVATDG